MTDTTNGWPGKPGVPLNPEKDKFHWLIRKNEQWPEAWRWNPGADGWCAEYAAAEGIGSWAESEGDGQPEGMAKWYRYLGPCLTPDGTAALQARVAELEAETKKAKWIHQYEVKEFQARATKLTRLVEILVENDPEDMAADAVTVLDVWRKEARELLARHARLDARQAAMEKMRENESADIRAALEGKKDEPSES